jgi:RNA polymerase sigma-70 factor (ECF subfamily)
LGDSFDMFFRREFRVIVKAVMYAGANLDDAEDAVSTAMIEAYLAWPLLTNPAAWVRTAALHNFINSAQRNRRRPLLEAQVGRRDRVDTTPAAPAEEPDERDHVLAALRELPPTQRKVMALVLDGHAPAQIADMLGVNPASVRSNLRHARQGLRRRLEVLAY